MTTPPPTEGFERFNPLVERYMELVKEGYGTKVKIGDGILLWDNRNVEQKDIINQIIEGTQDYIKHIADKMINGPGWGIAHKGTERYLSLNTAQKNELDDLVQEGIVGIIRNFHNYDSEKSGLSAFIGIVAATTMYNSAADKRIVKISSHNYNLRKIVYKNGEDKAIQKIIDEFGYHPLSEMLIYLSLTGEYTEMNTSAPIHQESEYPDKFRPIDTIEQTFLADDSSKDTFDEKLDKEDLSKKFNEAFSILTPKERKVIELVYGLGENDQTILKDIGKEFDVTYARIIQIKNRAMRKLQHPARKKIVEDFRGMA